MMKAATPHDAIDAFIPHVAKIDAILARLTELADGHLDVDPENVNWSDVASAARLKNMLQEVSDMVFSEGDYA